MKRKRTVLLLFFSLFFSLRSDHLSNLGVGDEGRKEEALEGSCFCDVRKKPPLFFSRQNPHATNFFFFAQKLAPFPPNHFITPLKILSLLILAIQTKIKDKMGVGCKEERRKDLTRINGACPLSPIFLSHKINLPYLNQRDFYPILNQIKIKKN